MSGRQTERPAVFAARRSVKKEGTGRSLTLFPGCALMPSGCHQAQGFPAPERPIPQSKTEKNMTEKTDIQNHPDRVQPDVIQVVRAGLFVTISR